MFYSGKLFLCMLTCFTRSMLHFLYPFVQEIQIMETKGFSHAFWEYKQVKVTQKFCGSLKEKEVVHHVSLKWERSRCHGSHLVSDTAMQECTFASIVCESYQYVLVSRQNSTTKFHCRVWLILLVLRETKLFGLFVHTVSGPLEPLLLNASANWIISNNNTNDGDLSCTRGIPEELARVLWSSTMKRWIPALRPSFMKRHWASQLSIIRHQDSSEWPD